MPLAHVVLGPAAPGVVRVFGVRMKVDGQHRGVGHLELRHRPRHHRHHRIDGEDDDEQRRRRDDFADGRRPAATRPNHAGDHEQADHPQQQRDVLSHGEQRQGVEHTRDGLDREIGRRVGERRFADRAERRGVADRIDGERGRDERQDRDDQRDPGERRETSDDGRPVLRWHAIRFETGKAYLSADKLTSRLPSHNGPMANRLAAESSPYLLQHADNPVDWYAWGPEALAAAKRENKPILLSIGYAACHWCHVMAHESFEDDATAALMNERFVNIKVDREERPDLDAIYMQAVQAMTGQGGWPMTMFLTPDGVPFYGGTYFPKDERHGMPSFKRVLAAVSDSYRNRPNDVARTAASVREMYEAAQAHARHETPAAVGGELLDAAYRALAAHFDERHGGFSGAPKFPQTMAMDFLLRYWARKDVEQALAMVS